jgi:hypothetical protein
MIFLAINGSITIVVTVMLCLLSVVMVRLKVRLQDLGNYQAGRDIVTGELFAHVVVDRIHAYKASRYKSEARVHMSFYFHCCHPLCRCFGLQNGEL